jgi:pimeloyl-ACP methyl ester carboxylesterase
VQRVHLVGHDWGAAVAWRVAQQFPDRLLTVTVLSVPHPGAFMKALVTSRQRLASWYMYLFQLPRIPEWYMMRGRETFTLSGLVKSRAGHAPDYVLGEYRFEVLEGRLALDTR